MRSINTYGSSSQRRLGSNPLSTKGFAERIGTWIPAFAGMTKVGAGMTKEGALALTLLALPLAACTPNDPTFGGAVRHNYALQVIDPDPQYAGVPNEGGSGDLAKGAVERYRTDKVKKPKSIRTTSGVSGGGGSGGGGSN